MKKLNTTNLTKLYDDTNLPITLYCMDDFCKEQIVECSIFKGFMRVLGKDIDLNYIYIYKINELSDVYTLKPNQISVAKVDSEIVELLYL